MSTIKETLKQVKWLMNCYVFVNTKYYQILTLISPTLNTKARFKSKFGRKIDLENPQTLNEKILKLKLDDYIYNPLVKQCADKYSVRKYIENNGCSDILIPLIASYDKVDEIKWTELPDAFAMKWNFGCGFNVICPDKTKLDITETCRKLKKWGKDKSCYLDFSEMQYKDVLRKIIVEQYLKPSNGLLPADYKVYCFHGTPQAILVIEDRGTDRIAAGFFDCNWSYISSTGKEKYQPFENVPEKPLCLKQMLEYSSILSKPFPFVRVDYYIIDSQLYFGEMTFTPAGGHSVSQCIINGKEMGDLL